MAAKLTFFQLNNELHKLCAEPSDTLVVNERLWLDYCWLCQDERVVNDGKFQGHPFVLISTPTQVRLIGKLAPVTYGD